MDKFKKDFPILMSRDVVYLDSGATSQKPASVIDAINNYYNNHNSNNSKRFRVRGYKYATKHF